MIAKCCSNVIPASNTHLPLGFCPCKYHHIFFFKILLCMWSGYWDTLLNLGKIIENLIWLRPSCHTVFCFAPPLRSWDFCPCLSLGSQPSTNSEHVHISYTFWHHQAASVSSNLLAQTKVLAWLSSMVNIITECVIAENFASSICPHAAGLSGLSTIYLLAGE